MGGLLKAIPNWLARCVRWLRAALLHPLDALYDHIRFLRHSNSLFRRTGERQRLESLLTYYYHKVEKALAMPEVKPIFGLGYIDRLLELFEELGREPEGAQTVPFHAAHHALVQYREKVAPSLQRMHPKLLRRINDVLAAHPVPARGFATGGAESVNAQDLQPAQAWEHFVTLVRSRRSVRNFSPIPVPDEEIAAAVRLAQRTPSVCNRQSWRVHVFSEAADKAMILRHQNGNLGFGHLADRVLLVTADMRTFVSSGERNQAFLDGGLFSMSLLYALQARGITTCPLNLSISFQVDRRLRKAARIPGWETPLMMIAVGYPPDRLNVAASARLPTESMLFFRSLKREGGRANSPSLV